MKVVIFAGGLGTRIAEETGIRPKPMVDIGGLPILWHIMKIYSHYGYHPSILSLGYKGWEIKQYFLDYRARMSDFTIALSDEHTLNFHDERANENWEITFAETGL